MKTLSVQQPWASLICSGIKDVENRTWKTDYRGRILIHASSRKVPQGFFDEQYHEVTSDILNHNAYGNLPYINELPTSAIIGFVDVVGCSQEFSNSIYDAGDDQYKWKLENAYMFDEPITGVKGKLHLFEYEMDENNLPPYHEVQLRVPEVIGRTLFVPINNKEYEEFTSVEGERSFGLLFDETDPDLFELFKNEASYEFVDINEVAFVSVDHRKTIFKKFELSVSDFTNDKGKVVKLPCLIEGGEEPLHEIEIKVWE